MYCYKCGQQIPDQSKFCPKCGAVIDNSEVNQGKTGAYEQESINVNASMKEQKKNEYVNVVDKPIVISPNKPWYKRWWMIVFYVLVGLMIIGSFGDDDKSQTSQSTSASRKNSNGYSIGDVINISDYTITVNDAYTTNGDEYDSAKSGYEYVVVNVTIRNSGEDTIDYNPYDFQVQDSNGKITDPAITFMELGDELDYGSLASGGQVTGSVVFEEPINDDGLILLYQPDWFDEETVKIKIS